MTDAIEALETCMQQACDRVDAIFSGTAPKASAPEPELLDELNALLVMAKGIEQRHARELAATKTHIGDGRYWTMATDMTAIIESIEEALGTYERAEIHPIR